MIIKVTQDHISKGCRGSGYNCPVALAINEQANLDDPYVRCTRVTFYKDSFLHEIYFPSYVEKNIRRFDAYGNMEPFEFELDYPTGGTLD